MEHIRRAFDAFAGQYDAQRRWVIPEMDEFYGAAVWMAEWHGKSPAILDIGAGTGLLSALLLDRYPDAALTLLDISEQMLAVARQRFAGRENILYITGDYSTTDLGGKYDLVCSALSIHHLDDGSKRRLYCRVHDSLNPGGIFVNADQAAGETAELNRRYLEYWNDFFAKGPLSAEERAEIMRRRDTLDRNAKLSVQLGWLRDCGFEDVDVVYRNRMFAVLTGRRIG